MIVTDDLFLICCDKCDMWVHGHCIKMDATEGETVKKYYCPPCVTITGLQVQYKKSARRKKRRSGGDGTSGSGKKRRSSLETDADGDAASTPEKKKKVKYIQKVYPPHECGREGCAVVHTKKAKYCSADCGLAQAKLVYERGLALSAGGIIASAEHVFGMSRADEEDLTEWGKVGARVLEKQAAMRALEAKRLKHEELIRANLGRTTTERGASPSPSPRASAKKDDFLFDCQCCGRQIAAASFVRHSEQCFMKVMALCGVWRRAFVDHEQCLRPPAAAVRRR